MAVALNISRVMSFEKGRDISRWLIIACGAWLMGLGFYFSVLRPAFLPEDLRFMDASLTQIRVAVPGLEGWLHKVFTVMGLFMAGSGVLAVFVAAVAMPLRFRWTSWAIALAGILTVAGMSAVNFALHSDYRWLLLIPVLVWLAGLTLYVFAQRDIGPGTHQVAPTEAMPLGSSPSSEP
jgi:hypothetical protein